VSHAHAQTTAPHNKWRSFAKAALFSLPIGCVPVALAYLASSTLLASGLMSGSAAAAFYARRIKTPAKHLVMSALGVISGIIGGAVIAISPFLERVPTPDVPPAQPEMNSTPYLPAAPSISPLQQASLTFPMQKQNIKPALLTLPIDVRKPPQIIYRM
jgi:hypothetical protein